MQNNPVAKIENTKISVITYQDVPVISTALLAELYETDSDNIKKNFSNNATRFIEGKHYFKLEGAALKQFKNIVNNVHHVPKNTARLMLWTERGAARHAKMLDTDQAWDIFEKLEDSYFSTKTLPAISDKITAEQAGVLFNIVHGRACGNAKQIIEMWGRLKRHFRYSTYHNLKAIHFEDAVAYLENMELKGELPTPQNIPQTPYFLSQQGGREFDARLRSLFDLAGLMASRGDDIAAVFQRQAKDLNKFMAGA